MLELSSTPRGANDKEKWGWMQGKSDQMMGVVMDLVIGLR